MGWRWSRGHRLGSSHGCLLDRRHRSSPAQPSVPKEPNPRRRARVVTLRSRGDHVAGGVSNAFVVSHCSQVSIEHTGRPGR
jgi:hypothetical protein